MKKAKTQWKPVPRKYKCPQCGELSETRFEREDWYWTWCEKVQKQVKMMRVSDDYVEEPVSIVE